MEKRGGQEDQKSGKSGSGLFFLWLFLSLLLTSSLPIFVVRKPEGIDKAVLKMQPD